MVVYKVFLLITVFTTSLFLGFAYGDRYSKRYKNLLALQNSIRQLEMEITLYANPLPDILDKLSESNNQNISKLFSLIRADMMNSDEGDIYYSFIKSQNFLKKECLLKDNDIGLFVSLGKVIGKTDRGHQIKEFKYIYDQLDLLIDESRKERNDNEKMYRSLGLLLGLGIVIILI